VAVGVGWRGMPWLVITTFTDFLILDLTIEGFFYSAGVFLFYYFVFVFLMIFNVILITLHQL